jgi:hypothetical protein
MQSKSPDEVLIALAEEVLELLEFDKTIFEPEDKRKYKYPNPMFLFLYSKMGIP